MRLNLHDIQFILEQIELAERHAAGAPESLRALVGDPLLSLGLRTVDGSFNNLIPGREAFGSADRAFPLLLPQFFRSAEAVAFDVDGPGGQSVGNPTSYASINTNVFDSQPRVISNLISDQTSGNAAAVAAQIRNEGSGESSEGSLDIPNVAPDEGLSAPFNSWFTLFGQFFDHGLDLVEKGGGTIFVPLKDDDPLVVGADGVLGTADDLAPHLRFMALTRTLNSQVSQGPDGVFGTSDDIHRHTNETTPFVDQNQTYTSHPAHQAFLREYVIDANGSPVSTGRLLDGANGGLATWADVKAQARTVLGIELRDVDVFAVPQLLTDQYGRLLLGPGGQAQLVTTDGLVQGNRAAPISTATAQRTEHAFLDDLAHHADPLVDHDRNPATPKIVGMPDADPGTGDDRDAGTYDNEMLDAHFITGDGRGNENIGLTAVHHIFHSEHNRLVQFIQQEVTGTPVEAHFRLANGNWNGERLFQAARFATEMQYQHLVFEEFGRKVQPQIDVFSGYDVDIDPAITAEFAHVVYRFGHSMLTDTVSRVNPDGSLNDIGLIQAFLNPIEFNASGVDADAAAASIVKGMTRQVANHIDEFVVEAVRNNLVGLPLDLGAVNIARGRDAGVPSLNSAREQFFAATSDSALAPYQSWLDFGDGIKNPESLVNFIAAYGTHHSILAATTLAGKRAAAELLVNGGEGEPGDRFDFLNATGAYEGGSRGGLNNVDFWIGGLAERTMPFGGLLGSTFSFVFETQMERLQDGDRLYYLARTAGLNFLAELEGNSFADLIMRNLPGVKHLPADVFSTPSYTFERGDASTWVVQAGEGRIGLVGSQLRYTGGEHIVMGGTEGNDNMRGGDGDDTFYGDGGNDRLEGGAGNDALIGGAGNDVLLDAFGDDNFKGGDGNDVISTGLGVDLAIGGAGSDFIIHGGGLTESFGGQGNDFIIGGTATDTVFAGEGHDWIEGGNQADLLQGDNGDPFQSSTIIGHDVIIGGGGNDDYDAESGDDILVAGTGVERYEGMLGFDWVTHYGSTVGADDDMLFLVQPPDVPVPPTEANRDRFDLVEAISGGAMNDILRGDNRGAADLTAVDPESGLTNTLENVGLISGLSNLIGGATSFSGGNIMIGGGGNDTLQGRGGNDILDGDAYLRVQLQVGTQRFDSLNQLRAQAVAGTLDPGTIQIVREIVVDAVGDDLLDGGLGADVMRGRGGNDTYIVDNAGDTTVENANEGTDAVNSTVNWTLAANTENLTLTGAGAIAGAGNALNNVITGNDAANVLTGLAGDDTLTGNGGADTLNGGAGNDNLSGGQGSDTLDGDAGDDTLDGGGGDDTLTGNAGDDILDGGAGDDRMSGGLGNDTYVVDSLADVVVEAVGGGIDTVRTNLTYSLDALPNIENLTLVGPGNFNGTGNGLDNVLQGNAGDNVLVGQGGNDLMSGGAGADTLRGGEGADTLEGDAGADRLEGGAGADRLEGGANNDTLIGGAGNDTLIGGAGDDMLVFGTGFGADTVTGFDFNPAGGQDKLDISALGITASTFAAQVSIQVIGGNTVITIGGDTITLTGVTGVVNADDFVLRESVA